MMYLVWEGRCYSEHNKISRAFPGYKQLQQCLGSSLRLEDGVYLLAPLFCTAFFVSFFAEKKKVYYVHNKISIFQRHNCNF